MDGSVAGQVLGGMGRLWCAEKASLIAECSIDSQFAGAQGGASGGGGASRDYGDEEDGDGLTIVLSPVQLAAMLNGSTLSGHDRFINRLWGGGQLFFSALQLVGAGALLAVPDPTLVTKAGGIVLGAHGLDSGQAALRQVWSGEQTNDLTQEAGEAAAKKFGASDRTAQWVGIGLDVAVPLSVSVAFGAERILAVRAGRISLVAEESAGGHTIAKHVGQTESALRARLVSEPRLKAASTFKSLAGAEKAVTNAITNNRQLIKVWTAGGCRGNLALPYTASSQVGEGVVRATGRLESMTKLRVVLKVSKQAGRQYFVLTAYPEI